MLAKAVSLKTLELNVNDVEVFEMIIQDQNKMSYISDEATLRMSTYHRQKRAPNTEQINNNGLCFITTRNNRVSQYTWDPCEC